MRKIKYDDKTWFETHNGYYRYKSVYLHRYVWEKANGPTPPDMAVKHKDGDKSNISLDNLELCPRSASDMARRAQDQSRQKEAALGFAQAYAVWLTHCRKDGIGLPLPGETFEMIDGTCYVFEGARLRINRKGEMFAFYAFEGVCAACGKTFSTWVPTRVLDNTGIGRYCREHSTRVWGQYSAAFEIESTEGSPDLICRKLPEEPIKPKAEDGSDLI